MKKVLIITPGFPGLGDRNAKIIKYLSERHDLYVITNRTRVNPVKDINWAQDLRKYMRIYKTFCVNKSPFRIFSKYLGSPETASLLERFFLIPDLYINWVPSAFIKAIRLIRRENIDIVITSSPPESVHVTGLLLKACTGIKWMAEFQDLWTSKKIVYRPPSLIHDMVTQKIESAIYEKADHVIANTNGNKEVYIKQFGVPDEKITVVNCGYDPDEIVVDEGAARNEMFSIGYMGYFDKPGFPWELFLSILKKLIDVEGRKIMFNVCGHVSSKARMYIEQNGLSGSVRLHGTMPHDEAFRITCTNDLLLVLLYETGYSKAIVTHKLYHYLAMNKPIAAIAEEDGEVAEIIGRTRTGRVVSASRPGAVRDIFAGYHDEWKRHGRLHHEPDIGEIRKYDASLLSRRLSDSIDRCLRQCA